jgi:hypothetical protein
MAIPLIPAGPLPAAAGGLTSEDMIEAAKQAIQTNQNTAQSIAEQNAAKKKAGSPGEEKGSPQATNGPGGTAGPTGANAGSDQFHAMHIAGEQERSLTTGATPRNLPALAANDGRRDPQAPDARLHEIRLGEGRRELRERDERRQAPPISALT